MKTGMMISPKKNIVFFVGELLFLWVVWEKLFGIAVRIADGLYMKARWLEMKLKPRYRKTIRVLTLDGVKYFSARRRKEINAAIRFALEKGILQPPSFAFRQAPRDQENYNS